MIPKRTTSTVRNLKRVTLPGEAKFRVNVYSQENLYIGARTKYGDCPSWKVLE